MKFTSIKSEGGLIPFDILEKIYSGDIMGQSTRDFGIESGSVLDEISKAWKAARTFYSAFQLRLNRLKHDDSSVRDTREYWIKPLLESIGFPNVTFFAKADEVAGKTYAISHRANDSRESLPIHIVGCPKKDDDKEKGNNLDKRAESGRPRLSPHSLMQEFLNHTEHLWGIVTNGSSLRLLRDSSKISRPIFIEFDLQQILEQEKFNEFALFFRLVHFTRLPKHQDDSDDCLIEKYYKEAINTGGRVREKLRDGVEEAIKIFGNGFLIHPENKWLRNAIDKNEIDGISYFRQLLRLVYRLLFLMVSEERNLVGPTDPKKEPIYYNYYSVNRLRELSHTYIPGVSKPSDLWESLLVTFKLYSDESYGNKLSISALNGDLFGSHAIPTFEKCKLYNKDLLSAIKNISLYDDDGNKRRINYLALDVEELGSVYESILDFHPLFNFSPLERGQRGVSFQLVFGSERKTTGSFYTNHDLVHELIESALVPVIKRITSKQIPNEQKIKELLRLKVCDTSMGSGHFLLAAARRIALEIAMLRSGEDYPTPTEYRIAIRDVIQRCIYGVDLNPLAVDLCKLALWLEGHTKGKPLSFLDHRIRNGNSLIGAFSYEQIKKGIPDDAFNPVTGDNKEVARYFKKRNKEERHGQFSLFSDTTSRDITSLSKSFSLFDDLTINSADDYHKAEEQFEKLKNSPKWLREWHLANIWTYAFFSPLTNIGDRTVPTHEQLLNYISTPNSPNAQLIGKADAASLKNKFFHWFLEFPDVFANGGFDCVLGNPPWEQIQIEEQEYFKNIDPNLAKIKKASERKKRIEELSKLFPQIYSEFIAEKHSYYLKVKFIKYSGKFTFAQQGWVNSYTLFTELSFNLINTLGRTGLIVQSGIALEDTSKEFYQFLNKGGFISSLYDFENKKGLFPNVHRMMKFCLLTLSKTKNSLPTQYAFFLQDTGQLKEDWRLFNLSPEDINLLNPNTQTCMVFRSRFDAEIVKRIYLLSRIMVDQKNVYGNPSELDIVQMFNISDVSSQLLGLLEYEQKGYILYNSTSLSKEKEFYEPVYESKFIHQFDHRYASFELADEYKIKNGQAIALTMSEKQNSKKLVIPRYWLPIEKIDSFFKRREHSSEWLLVFRMVTSPTNERTFISAVIRRCALSNSLTLIHGISIADTLLLLGNINSFLFDYVVRQRVGGMNINVWNAKQFPILDWAFYNTRTFLFEDIRKWISNRTFELSYTAEDLVGLARDYNFDGRPFIWDEERRFLIRCELDALYFKLYGLNREEVDYVMETFPIVKRRDIEKYDEYRTKRVILEIFDEMLECEKQGKQYQTRLDPPPADPRVAHRE